MNNKPSILDIPVTRRSFLNKSGKFASAGALSGLALPMVHGQSKEETKLALVGCGGRGTGAASNALSVSQAFGPRKLVAMADVFQYRIDQSYNGLSKKHKDLVDVTPDRKFIGFDGYQESYGCTRSRGMWLFLLLPVLFVGYITNMRQERSQCIYGKTGHSGWSLLPERF